MRSARESSSRNSAGRRHCRVAWRLIRSLPPPTSFTLRRRMTPRMKLALALLLTAGPVVAQQSMKPPKYLRLVEENVKVGQATAHEKNEMAFVSAFAQAKTDAWYFAFVPGTGNTNVLYAQGFSSYAEMEKADGATEKVPGLSDKMRDITDKDGQYLNGVRVMLTEFRSDLTIGDMPDLSKVHGYRLTTYRVRIGHTNEFEEARKLGKAITEKANPGAHLGVF